MQAITEKYKILAFDPGGTTGVAYFGNALSTPKVSHLGPERHHAQLWALLNNVRPTHVVYETFEFRNRGRDNLELISRDYIGIIDLYCDLNPVRVYRQSASQAKGFIPDRGPRKDVPIKRLGWYMPAHKHGMDAVRHLIYFITGQDHDFPKLRMDILERGFKPE